MYTSPVLWFTILVAIFTIVDGHGCLTKITSNGQIACAVNANDYQGCNSAIKVRTLIPRSGNDGVCANPPGCEASFNCDWCGLEKVKTFTPIVGYKWWTGTPAAHWTEATVAPQFPCMSKQSVFGANGIMPLNAGDSVTANMYINADHSGLYRYEIMCGDTPVNNQFTPITPWMALHPSKDGANLPPSRIVGSTKADTDAYFTATTCTGAACSYRMNRNNGNPDSAHCKGNVADCYNFDTFTIPATCSGNAILRWLWNSAEGPETYANCLDITVTGGAPVTTVAPTSASPTTASPTETGATTSPTTASPTKTGATTAPTMSNPVSFSCAKRWALGSQSCSSEPFCCSTGVMCYEKNQYWSACMETCTPGPMAGDTNTDPWSCTKLGIGFAEEDGHLKAPAFDSGSLAKNSIFFAFLSLAYLLLE